MEREGAGLGEYARKQRLVGIQPVLKLHEEIIAAPRVSQRISCINSSLCKRCFKEQGDFSNCRSGEEPIKRMFDYDAITSSLLSFQLEAMTRGTLKSVL